MTSNIKKSSLLSRAVRKTQAGGSGIRKIDFSGVIENVRERGGLLRRIFSGARSLIGFAGRFLFGRWDFSSAVDWLVERSFELVEFDWNQSDEELRQQQEQNIQALFGTWGSAAGGAVGWFTSISLGYGITMVLPVIGSARLAKLVAASATDEAIAATLGQLQGAVRRTAGVISSNLLIDAYIGTRNFIRETNPRYRNWGRKGGPRWTIAEQFEKRIERINNKRVRSFVQGFTSSFFDSFIEGAFVIANELDSQVESGQASKDRALGPVRRVDIFPDFRAREKIRIEAPEELLKQAIQNEVTAHRRLADKDVGFIVGEPTREARTVAPDRRVLRVIYKTRPSPPWGTTSEGYKLLSLKIPDLKNTSWEELKRVLRPYVWGRHYHVIPLDNGRKVMSHGSTPAIAKTNAERLLSLTTASALSNRTEGAHEDTNPARRRDSVLMYPVHAVFEDKRVDSVTEASFISPDGTPLSIERTRFDLWPTTKPDNVPVRL